MIRLDRYLVQLNTGSRKQVKEMIKKGRVTVDGSAVKNAELKVDEEKACVCVNGKECHYQKFAYYMLNKPAGVVSATTDREKTVLELLPEEKRKDIFPVGRLDKDTEGLLLLTNNGELAHALLSPQKYVCKTYFVRTKMPLSKEAKKTLQSGVDIGEKKQTALAKVADGQSENEIYLTITEGKFHQVKRMIHAVGDEVIYLKRISMAGLRLDETLKAGEYRTLTEEETEGLQQVLEKRRNEEK